MNWILILILFAASILLYIYDLVTALRVAVKYPIQFKQSETNLALCWVFDSKDKKEYDKRYQKFLGMNIANFAILVIVCFTAASILGIDSLTSITLPLVIQIIVSLIGISSNIVAYWRLEKNNNQTTERRKE